MDTYYRTPLGIAVKNGNAAVVKVLLDNGADPNKRVRDQHLLELTKDPEIIQLLKSAGADN